MTREEAIKEYIMPALKRTWNDDRCIEIISAIEQDPCDDAISRQAVIDGINRYFHDEYYQRTSIQDCRDCLIEDVINKLPSVNPKPKRRGEE